jgi:hypothetical protein
MTAPFPASWKDRYRIDHVLGRGGMGEVFLARDLELERLVAIKVPRFLDSSDSAKERFCREAKALAAVRHPNLVEVFSVHGDARTPAALVMEYLQGITLRKRLNEGWKAGPEELIRLAKEIGGALDALHRAGMIHRDLKPANVMIKKTGEAVLMDLGLVLDTHLTRLSSTGKLLGTPAYLAPEQVREGRGSPASDIFQLGALLFEASAGRSLIPWSGGLENLLERITQGRFEKFPVNSSIPRAMQEVLFRTTSVSPSRRPRSGAALWRELVRASRTRRRGGKAVRGSLGMAFLGAALIGFFLLVGRQEHPTTPSPVLRSPIRLATGGHLEIHLARPMLGRWGDRKAPMIFSVGRHLLALPGEERNWQLHLESASETTTVDIDPAALAAEQFPRYFSSLLLPRLEEELSGLDRREVEKLLHEALLPTEQAIFESWLPILLSSPLLRRTQERFVGIWEDVLWRVRLLELAGDSPPTPMIPAGKIGWRGGELPPWSNLSSRSPSLSVHRTRDRPPEYSSGGVFLAVEAASNFFGQLNNSFSGGAVALEFRWPEGVPESGPVALSVEVASFDVQLRLDISSLSDHHRLLRLWDPRSEDAEKGTYAGWITSVLPGEIVPRGGELLDLEVRPLAWPMIGTVIIRRVQISWPSSS